MNKPTQAEVLIAAGLLEQLLCNFEPVDDDDVQAAKIAEKVAKYFLTNCKE